jgi:hypothetical protein
MHSAPQPQRAPTRNPDARTVATLNHLLKGEIAATETYTQAITKIDDRSQVPLQDNLECHTRRAQALRERIRASGAVPVDGSGMWGTFARLIERSAALLGRDAAIAALEEGEDHGLRDYREALAQLDSSTRAWVEQELLPAQVRTHAVLRDARRSGPGPGSGPGAGGIIPTMLMAMAISFSALLGTGCHDERKVSLDEVTPEARATITRLAGTDKVTAIDEITATGKDVAYDVTITRAGKVEHYHVNGYGLIQD